jgi:hypothetical protein
VCWDNAAAEARRPEKEFTTGRPSPTARRALRRRRYIEVLQPKKAAHPGYRTPPKPSPATGPQHHCMINPSERPRSLTHLTVAQVELRVGWQCGRHAAQRPLNGLKCLVRLSVGRRRVPRRRCAIGSQFRVRRTGEPVEKSASVMSKALICG